MHPARSRLAFLSAAIAALAAVLALVLPAGNASAAGRPAAGNRLLDSTLDPVLDDATKQAEITATAAETDTSEAVAEALLSVTVCDPACGSGHFLVAAARRIAKRVASVRAHNPEPTTEALHHALRDVIGRCIYGVDLNPMAVELAKVSLWLEALDPGKPLSFLDAHIRQGNGLIGATPALVRQGHPIRGLQAHRGRRPEVCQVPGAR